MIVLSNCLDLAVELSGGDFRGLLLLPLGNRSGSFLAASEPSRAKIRLMVECTANNGGVGVTHSNADVVQSIRALWLAPSSGSALIRTTVMDGTKDLASIFIFNTTFLQKSSGFVMRSYD